MTPTKASEHPEPVAVLMVAIGGYGYYYLRTLLDEVAPARAVLAGVVDPAARQSRAWPEIAERHAPVFETVGGYFAAGHRADLTVVASPIQHHVPQSCAALASGSHVLCDKPVGATIQEALALSRARAAAARWVMIGYQWSYSDAIQALKRDILDGLFGAPRRFAAICCWPRDLAYYGRNNWAGRLRDPESSRWVLDGPANNAMAHYLHNLLYLSGPAVDRSATPRLVDAELYRAYAIESCDTVACRVITTAGLEILFFASHATDAAIEPCFRLEFDEATITFAEKPRTILAVDRNGRRREYGSPDETPQFRKLFDAIVAVRRRLPLVCGPEAASAQTLAVNGMHESVPEVVSFPASLVQDEASARRRFVPGLLHALRCCYERGVLPHEAGTPWAVAGKTVDVSGYDWFPGGTPTHDLA